MLEMIVPWPDPKAHSILERSSHMLGRAWALSKPKPQGILSVSSAMLEMTLPWPERRGGERMEEIMEERMEEKMEERMEESMEEMTEESVEERSE